jgi:hypothetical protein
MEVYFAKMAAKNHSEEFLLWEEVFPASEDGKRHPTRQELHCAAKWLLENSHGAVRELVLRLATVAPED